MDGFESAEPSPSYSPQASPEPADGGSQLAGGCSSGEAEAMAAPATPAPAAPAADAADEAWECSFCACEHVGTEATFLTCKLCNTTRNPTKKKPPLRAHRHTAPQPAPQPPATDGVLSNDDEDDAPLSRRAPAAAQPAKHKLPAASAADSPPAKKRCQSSGGAPAGKNAEEEVEEEVEEQRYDESD
eukprot:scaffold37621_cov57-Phaeocystis_antarctica.AAC.1